MMIEFFSELTRSRTYCCTLGGVTPRSCNSSRWAMPASRHLMSPVSAHALVRMAAACQSFGFPCCDRFQRGQGKGRVAYIQSRFAGKLRQHRITRHLSEQFLEQTQSIAISMLIERSGPLLKDLLLIGRQAVGEILRRQVATPEFLVRWTDPAAVVWPAPDPSWKAAPREASPGHT